MAKVASRLQTVIKVKHHQEKMAQQQLLSIQNEHHREQEALAHLNETKDEAVKSTLTFGRAKANDMQMHRAFIFKLSRQINHQTAKVVEIQGKENEKRKELVQRAQSRKMVENLDEKQRAETARKIDRKEQETIDDLANRPHKTK